MKHGARCVDHRAKRRLVIRLDASFDLRKNRIFVEVRLRCELAADDSDTATLEHFATTPRDILTTEAHEPGAGSGMRQQPVYRGQFALPCSRLAHDDEACTVGDDFQQPEATAGLTGLSTNNPRGFSGEGRRPVVPLVFKTSLEVVRSSEGSTPSLLRQRCRVPAISPSGAAQLTSVAALVRNRDGDYGSFEYAGKVKSKD